MTSASTAYTVSGANKIGLNEVVGLHERLARTASEISGITFPTNVTDIQTTGYATPGDGGGLQYAYTASTPSHALYLTDAGGRIYEGVVTLPIRLKAFGATENNVADDKTAVDNAQAHPDVQTIDLGGNTVYYNGTFSRSKVFTNGAIRDTSGTVTFNDVGASVLITGTGGSAGKSVVHNPEWNAAKSGATAAWIQQGTASQPNFAGKRADVITITGDGTVGPFTLTPDWTVTAKTYEQIRATVYRASDGLGTGSFTVGNGISVSYDGATIDVTFDSATGTGDRIEVTIRDDQDDATANSERLSFVGSYDSTVACDASFMHSPHSIFLNSNGHNAAVGGSYNIGGTNLSYSGFLGGNGNKAGSRSSTVASAIFGQSNVFDGSRGLVAGLNNDSEADFASIVGGRDAFNDQDYVTILGGRLARAYSPGEIVYGLGLSTDDDPGIATISTRGGRRTTTASGVIALALVSGASSWTVPANSGFAGTAHVVARDENGDVAGWKLDFLCSEDGSNVTRVNDSTSDVSMTLISSRGSPVFGTPSLRGLGGNLAIRFDPNQTARTLITGGITGVQCVDSGA